MTQGEDSAKPPLVRGGGFLPQAKRRRGRWIYSLLSFSTLNCLSRLPLEFGARQTPWSKNTVFRPSLPQSADRTQFDQRCQLPRQREPFLSTLNRLSRLPLEFGARAKLRGRNSRDFDTNLFIPFIFRVWRTPNSEVEKHGFSTFSPSVSGSNAVRSTLPAPSSEGALSLGKGGLRTPPACLHRTEYILAPEAFFT